MISLSTSARCATLAGAAAGALLFQASPALACPQTPAQISEENVIAGTMDIDFATRTNLDTSGDLKGGSPALGAKDTYKFTLSVARTTEFAGTVERQPNLYSKIIRRRKQDALLTYGIDMAVLNPRDIKQKKVVGKWVGTIPIDTESGAFDLAGGKVKESPLRIAVDAVGTAKSFQDYFAGRLVGKAEEKASLAAYTFRRVVGNRTVEIKVEKTDPMRFENLVLAMGPAESYSRAVVNGRLDYDYETGNWYTDGIRFKYAVDGQDLEDIVTGSIKWVEDPDREANGKGFYDFNLRFNEEKTAKASTEASAFEALSDEEAFFAVDNSVSALTGRVSYVDLIPAGSELPSSSKVTYALHANKLTKQQIMNMFKLWMIGIGPINDE